MKSKKKVLFYIDTLGKGGLDKVVLDVVNNLNHNKYEVSVIRRFSKGYYTNFLNSNIITKSNIHFQNIKHPRLGHLVRVICDRLPRKVIYKLFIHKKYDVEIACGDAFPATIIGGSTNKKSKKILWEHMDVTLDESTATHFSYEKIKEFFGPFDKIVGVSKDCEKKFNEKYGFEEKTTYIYNPIDIKTIEKKSSEQVEDMYEEGFNILTIGRLMPQKAYLRLIDVVKDLYDRGIRFKLTIIGEGPQHGDIIKKIKQYDIEDRVKLLGFKENPYPYIKGADLVICSSIHESYCLVVAESLVLGTPVLSTKCTGPIELLDNGKYGMLVENSHEGLESGIERMVTDKKMLKHYRKMATERKSFFNVNRCVSEFEKLFEG